MEALAWTIPPSLAAIVWAAAWLQHARERKFVQEQLDRLSKLETASSIEYERNHALENRVALLQGRMAEAEQNISNLTERAFR